MLTLVACNRGDDSAQGGEDLELRMISMVRAETFDPFSTALADKVSMHAIFDTLLKFGMDGNPSPRVAESWVFEDDLTIVLTLRQDVYFHNGDKMTSADVVYTYERLLETPNGPHTLLFVNFMEAIDEYTIRVTRPAPFTRTLNFLAENIWIVNKNLHMEDPGHLDRSPIGTGAYRFISHEVDGSVRLEANENYFGGVPAFRFATVLAPIEPATAVVALETGEVDIITPVPVAQFPIIENNPDLVLVDWPSWTINTFQMVGGQFADDVNLRKAAFHAIDREKAILMAFDGRGTPARNFFADLMMADYDGIVDIGGFDIELARQYLEMSNYDPSQPLAVAADAMTVAIAQSIQDDLRQIGINITVTQMETNAFYGEMMSGMLDSFVIGFGTNMQSAEDYLMFYTTSGDSFGMFGPKNDYFDNLIAEIHTTFDDAARRELVRRAFEHMRDVTVPGVPIFEQTWQFAHSASITGLTPFSAPTYVYYLGDVRPVG